MAHSLIHPFLCIFCANFISSGHGEKQLPALAGLSILDDGCHLSGIKPQYFWRMGNRGVNSLKSSSEQLARGISALS